MKASEFCEVAYAVAGVFLTLAAVVFGTLSIVGSAWWFVPAALALLQSIGLAYEGHKLAERRS